MRKNNEYVFFTKNDKPFNGKITMDRKQALIILNDAMSAYPETFSYRSFNGIVNASAGQDTYKIEPITLYANQNRKYGAR